LGHVAGETATFLFFIPKKAADNDAVYAITVLTPASGGANGAVNNKFLDRNYTLNYVFYMPS
jgi:hypothetical protein